MSYGFNGDTCEFTNLVFEQSPDISQGVTEGEGENLEQGAGDQGSNVWICMQRNRIIDASSNRSFSQIGKKTS